MKETGKATNDVMMWDDVDMDLLALSPPESDGHAHLTVQGYGAKHCQSHDPPVRQVGLRCR